MVKIFQNGIRSGQKYGFDVRLNLERGIYFSSNSMSKSKENNFIITNIISIFAYWQVKIYSENLLTKRTCVPKAGIVPGFSRS